VHSQISSQINQYVRVLEYGVGPSGIRDAIPYLDFYLKLLNVSTVPLTVHNTVQGALRLNNKPLSGAVKIRSRSQQMEHNGEFTLVCRQWLSKEEADYILNKANDAEEISFCDVEITLASASEHPVTPQPLLVSQIKNKTVGDLLHDAPAPDDDITHGIYTHAGVMFQCLDSEHRLIFYIRVFNGLRRPIKIIDSAEGYILINGRPFHKKPDFTHSTSAQPEERLSNISLNQKVDLEEMDQIQVAFRENESVHFDFDSLYVYFDLEGQRHRLALPDGLICERGIKYVETLSMSATIEI